MDTHNKENIGKELVERFDILKLFFPTLKDVEWVDNEVLQKSGVDYRLIMDDLSVVDVDLKVGIGDYSECAIEISQKTIATNGQFTLTNTYDKKTNYFLYVLITGDIVDFVLLPYKQIARECKMLYKDCREELEIFPQDIEEHLSFNGTGYYVKFDYGSAISHHKLPGAKALMGFTKEESSC